MEGIILWFNDYKGYGEAQANDGQRFFFLKEDARLSPAKFMTGTKVCFQTSKLLLFGWPRAVNVVEAQKTITKNMKSLEKRI